MNGLRVLVTEDDGLNGLLLAEVLTAMGHVCSVETSEAGQVATAARSRPQLIIADIRLRKGSGISAVDEILRGGLVPHVFISAGISVVLAHRPGALALQKPFSESDLVHAIQRALVMPSAA